MIDLLMVLYWLAGVVVVGGAVAAFAFHSLVLFYHIKKGGKK